MIFWVKIITFLKIGKNENTFVDIKSKFCQIQGKVYKIKGKIGKIKDKLIKICFNLEENL